MTLLKRIHKWQMRFCRLGWLAWLFTLMTLSACQGGSLGEDPGIQGADNASNSMPAARYLLTVNPYGEGMGSVTSDGGDIDCGANCSGTFDEGSTVVLIATPGENSSFVGWSGGGCSGTENCRITLADAVTVSAYFTVAEALGSTTDSCAGMELTGTFHPMEGSVAPGFNDPGDGDNTLSLRRLVTNNGVIIPGINDGYSVLTLDLGAFERE